MKSIALVALLLLGCSKKTNKVGETGSATTTAPTTATTANGSGSSAGATPSDGSATGSGSGSAAVPATNAASIRPDADDLFSLAAGALVVHEPEGTDSSVHAWRLLDSDPNTDWGVDKDVILKDPFVIEMAGRSAIETVVLDAASMELPESRLPGKIKFEISDKSATDGFELLAEIQPKQPAADGMTFPVANAKAGRWVRVTFYDAQEGDTPVQDLTNLHAFGKRLSVDPMPTNITGTYETSDAEVSLKQNGNTVTGCRKGAKEPIIGAFEGRVLKFNWPETDDGFKGPAFAVFGKDHFFAGYWPTKLEVPRLSPVYFDKKLSDKPAPCPDDKKDPIATALEAGRVRLYGINFDTDSDHLKDESRTTLDAVKKTLDAHADWKITIEGHTDSTATHDHNQTLSDKRAAAVKAYLVKAGIAADRLDTAGLAETKPIAPNTDALGRAQNRRVELVKR